MKKWAPALAWALTILSITQVSGATMPAGCDCYVTSTPGTQIEIPALASYFPGCTIIEPDPPPRIVQMQGKPLSPPYPGPCGNADLIWVNPHGTPVAPNDNHKVGQTRRDPPGVDTVVCRTTPGTFDTPGSTQDIPIEMLQLSLTSNSCPIIVRCGGIDQTWRVNATHNGAQTPGAAHFVASSVTPSITGSIDLTSLPVNFKLDFERCDAPGTQGPINGLSLTFQDETPGSPDGNFVSPGTIIKPAMNRWLEIVLAGILLAMAAWFLIARRRSFTGRAA